MIRGVHSMFYSSDAPALREFFKNKLGLPAVDVGDGWLIFDLPEGDLGVHPTVTGAPPPSGTASVSFYCDDIEATVADLKSKGVEFSSDIENAGFGLVTCFKAPGEFDIMLYQPLYSKGHE